MTNYKKLEPKVEMKQFFRLIIVLVVLLLPFGKTAVGFVPSAGAEAKEANSPDAQLSSSWIQTNWTESNSFFNLCSSQNKVFARTWDSFNGGRMFLTADDGTNWAPIGSADSSIDILSIIMLDSGILAGTWNGFFQSTDDGTTWNTFTPAGIPADAAIWSIVKINSTLFAGTTGAVYKSTDNGITWAGLGSGIAANARITSIVASGDNLFAGCACNGIFKLSGNGTSWTAINTNLADTHISQLLVSDNRLFAVTLTGVYLSDNGGTSWAADPSGLRKVNCLVAVNGQIIAGTDDDGAYLSDNNGATWTSFSPGMPDDTRIWSMAINSDGIFAGTSYGIWFMSSPTETNVETEISVPSTLALKQNYPNPFSSTTNISFSIPSKSFVSLKIYDRLGREVATVFSEEIAAGQYTRKWDASNVSDGIYFYRLQAGSCSETKKLILVR